MIISRLHHSLKGKKITHFYRLQTVQRNSPPISWCLGLEYWVRSVRPPVLIREECRVGCRDTTKSVPWERLINTWLLVDRSFLFTSWNFTGPIKILLNFFLVIPSPFRTHNIFTTIGRLGSVDERWCCQICEEVKSRDIDLQYTQFTKRSELDMYVRFVL